MTASAGDGQGRTAKLAIGDNQFELPIIVGTEDERGLDISKLLAGSGYMTLDEGYGNTGATTSAITFLDGDRGILRYRGYPIEQLAEKATFLETAWLLRKGELPTKKEYDQWVHDI